MWIVRPALRRTYTFVVAARAVLDAQHASRYRDVQLGRDFGDVIEVLTGLYAGDTVVIHPGDDLAEGTVVEPVAAPAQSGRS